MQLSLCCQFCGSDIRQEILPEGCKSVHFPDPVKLSIGLSVLCEYVNIR